MLWRIQESYEQSLDYAVQRINYVAGENFSVGSCDESTGQVILTSGGIGETTRFEGPHK